MRSAALFLGLAGAAYAVTAAVLAVAGAVPTAPVVAGLDVDNYYAFQILFVLPLIYAVWVLTSGVLLALGTRGCHRSHVLVAASRAWGGPLLLAWAPSAVQAAFCRPGDGSGRMGRDPVRSGILADPLHRRSTRRRRSGPSRGSSWPRGASIRSPGAAAILTGLAAAAVAVGIFVLFVR